MPITPITVAMVSLPERTHQKFKNVIYFGSVTFIHGEESRLTANIAIINLGHENILRLRRRSSGTALWFHELAIIPGAVCKFYAMHRFPQLETYYKALAPACENLWVISMEHVDFISRNPIGSTDGRQLMSHLRKTRTVPNFRHCFHIANRALRMAQNG